MTAAESETLSQEIADTDERGFGMGLRDDFPVVEPYANSDPWDISSTLRKDAPETFLCPGCGKVILTDPIHLHTPASRQAVEGTRACPVCRGSFRPTRSDHLYCSDSCQRKGSRLGRETIADRVENDSWMRRCQAPDCEETLIGRTARAKYCSPACRVRAAYHQGV